MEVTVEEVLYRLEMQSLAGDLEAKLATTVPKEFGGLWLEHLPVFKVVVALTSGDAEVIAPYVDGTSLEPITTVVKVKYSIADLRQWAASALEAKALGQIEPSFDLRIDQSTNRIVSIAESPDEAAALEKEMAEALPAEVFAAIEVEVGSLAEPNPNIYGGLPLTTCTSGFSTRSNSGGQRGIATAGHCQASQAYLGYNLPLQAEDHEGNQDVQWHSLPSELTAVPKVKDNSGTRWVTATRSRANQPQGALVCGYGMTTGYRCGRIIWKDYAPSYIDNPSATFIVLHNDDGQDIANGGDSGGPWYNGTEAWGVHSGDYAGNDAIYLAVNYISSIGVSILLH